MSSLLTNTGAMTALQTLKMTNKNLVEVQGQISTGKKVATAKDDAPTWAIASVMKSDVAGFEAIGKSLAFGQSSVGLARTAAEQVTDKLKEVKQKIIDSGNVSFDRNKIQNEIVELRGSIGSIVNGAQLNGTNLLKGSGSMNVMASLDRDANGGVTVSSIAVNVQNLEQTGAAATALVANGAGGLNFGTNDVTDATVADGANTTLSFNTGALAADTKYSLTINDKSYAYTSVTGDDMNDVASALRNQVRADYAAGAGGIDIVISEQNDPTATAVTMQFTNNTGAALRLTAKGETDASGGGLAALAGIDVSTAAGAATALTAIEGLIQTATNAAAALGSSQKRLTDQSEFVGKLTDSINAGVGSLVDADMEETSARLQALQVQQQLGVQSLSIANGAPQSILSLFRG